VDADDGPTRACRLLSIITGLFGTTLVWLLARQLAPNRPGLWIAATAFAAFLPMRLAVISAVNNDALAEAMGTLSLLLMVRGVMGHWRKRDWLWLGLALGLALISKQSCILLLPAALIAVLLSSKGGEREGTAPADETVLLLRSGATVLAIVIVIAGWFFVRNHLLYGDPMAKKAFDAYFADAPTWESFRAGGFTYQKYLGERVFPTTMLSFWGWFGYMNPDQANLALGAYGNGPPSRWGYPPRSWLIPILSNVLLFALAGSLVYLVCRTIRARRGDADAPAGAGVGVGLLAIHAVFVFGAFLSFNTTYFQAQGRYLFPAIGAISLAIAAGLLEWARAAALIGAPKDPAAATLRERRWEAAAGCGIAAAVLALAAYAYLGVLVPGFAHS
jgi:4-amino-4-deoxy-L-arabinose transferase-like glycosyltransferase